MNLKKFQFANLGDKTFYHDIETAAIAAMKENVKTAVEVFSTVSDQ